MQFKAIWQVAPAFFEVDNARMIQPQRYKIVYAETGEEAGMFPMRFNTAEEAQALVDECHADAATAPKYR